MTNLKVAIPVFLVLLGLTFGVVSNIMTRYNLPGGDILQSVKDWISRFFSEKIEGKNVNFSMKTSKKDLLLNIKSPTNITIEASNITIDLGHKIRARKSNVTIYNFTGMLNYTKEIWISGSSSKVVLGDVEIDDIKDMKLYAIPINVRTENLRVSRLELRDVKGFLNLSDMSMDIDHKNVTISLFSGTIRINEEMTVQGSCSKIYVNNHLIR